MARMHTKKRGRSKSKKPRNSNAKMWVAQSEAEITDLIEKLAREGKREAEIGLILRDTHGIPGAKSVLGRKLGAVLAEKKLTPQYPSDLIDLIRTAVGMRQHLEANKKDLHNKLRLTRVESKIKRLVKYYRGNKLPEGWKYEPEKAALLVK